VKHQCLTQLLHITAIQCCAAMLIQTALLRETESVRLRAQEAENARKSGILLPIFECNSYVYTHAITMWLWINAFAAAQGAVLQVIGAVLRNIW
jgi:hypothetical protein